jgi:hypothetical protein
VKDWPEEENGTKKPKVSRQVRVRTRFSCPSWIVFLVVESKTLILEDLEIPFQMAIEEHIHLPGPCKDFRILDGDRIIDVAGIDGSIAFDHMQRIAMEVARAVKPGAVIEINEVYHERFTLPVAARVAP